MLGCTHMYAILYKFNAVIYLNCQGYLKRRFFPFLYNFGCTLNCERVGKVFKLNWGTFVSKLFYSCITKLTENVSHILVVIHSLK